MQREIKKYLFDISQACNLLTILLILLFIGTFYRISSAESGKCWTCTDDLKPVGPCFKVHGRLSLYNGNPSLRIWPIGTKRLLGVLKDEVIPDIIEHYLHFGNNIYGDFVVCPLTKSKAGDM